MVKKKELSAAGVHLSQRKKRERWNNQSFKVVVPVFFVSRPNPCPIPPLFKSIFLFGKSLCFFLTNDLELCTLVYSYMFFFFFFSCFFPPFAIFFNLPNHFSDKKVLSFGATRELRSPDHACPLPHKCFCFIGFTSLCRSAGMSVQHQRDEFDYMAEEGGMASVVDDEMGDDLYRGDGAEGVRDEYDLLTRVTDTSAAQARRGKDIQGIPWDRLNSTREKYRQTRIEQYKNYENIPSSSEVVEKECLPVEKGAAYYDFRHNTRLVKPTILHFQLRNLLWATSKHDVYLMSNYSVLHWSATSHNLTEVLNFSGHVAPVEKHSGCLLEGFTQTQISTLAVKGKLLIAGGFQGELVCKSLDRKGVCFCTRTTFDENAITNAIDIYNTSSGAVHFMASNNDCGLREYDVERFQLLNNLWFPWPVNHASRSPDGKLVTIVGDNVDGLLVDSQNGKTVANLVGHQDYSFASAWHPDGYTFATGNQDKTCRVWDVRKLSSSIAILKGNLGAVRSIRFSSDGQFMAVAEPADFVHIYNTREGYNKRQEIDFFGEISGVSISPDDESIFIGVWERTYASLLQYSKIHAHDYLNSYF